jgi:hypothetical protein
MGAQHFVLHEEEEAFADWMNRALGKDKDVQHHLPLAVCHAKHVFNMDVVYYRSGISTVYTDTIQPMGEILRLQRH